MLQIVSENAPAAWDKNLPSLETGKVDVNGTSMQEAWKNFSSNVMQHSVLFVQTDFSTVGDFHFQHANATVRDFLNALVSAYPAYAWEQDARTGVIWIHPKDMAMKDLLPVPLTVTNDYLGLRMQEDVLEKLAANPFSNVRAKKWGTGFTDTFDYPVNIPAGAYMVRDIISLCCAANPSISFYITQIGKRDIPTVIAVNLTDTGSKNSAGARAWWNSEVKTTNGADPTWGDVRNALANTDPIVRENARKYLEITDNDAPIGDIIHSAPDDRDGLLVSLGALSVMARTKLTTLTEAVDKIETILDSSKVSYGDVSVLGELELFRLTHAPKWLQALRKSTAVQIMPAQQDIQRIVRLFGNTEERTALTKALPFLPAAGSEEHIFQFQTQ